ncbi:hypothetical protein ACFQUU_22645 [Herbaspirillum sp. GCM10030257]|uniref:hypothetical protein n=1 Tax=Herbaspirillum sp. GCM10030257 TaxID=3273393 RepID=UPI00361B3EFC
MKKLTTCFQAPVSMARPRGTRRIDVYGLKIGRRLQCFGEAAYSQWVRLEASPSVQLYCERPAYLDFGGVRIPADYWVKEDNRESLLLIGESGQISTTTIGSTQYDVRAIPSAELAPMRTWIENWERMLPVITSYRDLLTDSFLKSVEKFVSEPMQLSFIEKELGTSDPTTVRAAVFTLLHRGRLHAPQLRTEPLSFLSHFEPENARP